MSSLRVRKIAYHLSRVYSNVFAFVMHSCDRRNNRAAGSLLASGETKPIGRPIGRDSDTRLSPDSEQKGAFVSNAELPSPRRDFRSTSWSREGKPIASTKRRLSPDYR